MSKHSLERKQLEHAFPPVLLVGHHHHREFDAAVAWLRQHTQLRSVATMDEAVRVGLEGGCLWHTVVLVQSRPGCLSSGDVERLGRAFPLSHFVALLGSLCEGEPRSGRPWPGVTRVYWYQWLVRCESELQDGSKPTSWQLPRTASDVERVESFFDRPPKRGTGLVAVVTRSGLLFDALASACHLAGYSSVWVAEQRRRVFSGAVAAIWDGTTRGQVDFDHLRLIVRQLPDVPVLALLGFPRYDQQQQARDCGACGVLATPFLLPDLWESLHQMTSRNVG